MLCQRCKKKQATVHMTEIAGSEKKEVHLCEDCSQTEGVTLKGQMSLADFLAGLIKSPATREVAKLAEIRCPECGINYIEFQSKGRLGCAKDYDVFGKLLEPLVEKIHGGTEHVGKAPAHNSSGDSFRLRLVTLRKSLKAAIDEEKYELAAQLRDEIQKLEGGERGT
jgi:protein arginine kinase activator